MNVYDISDRLTDISSELTVVIAAIDGLHCRTEGYGLYLMLTRHIEQIDAITKELCPPLK